MRDVVPVTPPFWAGRSEAASSADAAAGARAVIGRHLTYCGLQSLTDDALLVVTELLSNAARHGKPPWSVSMCLMLSQEDGRRYVRLEVADAGSGIDINLIRARWRHPSGSLTDGGRGLFIVDTLASSWGNDRTSHGHTVWAELEVKPGSPVGSPAPSG
ncbi:ATP-binding protein [Streptomyces sp. NPDC002994]|uniref:ATP-binding protein n=1 Tax=Streptomyces sp. NPDC002994 TaxID=3154441 RepID=UPI00339E35CE